MIRTRRVYLRVLHGLVALAHAVVAVALFQVAPAAVAVGLAGLAWAVSAWRVRVIADDPPRSTRWVRWVDLPVCGHVVAGLFGLCLWPLVVLGAWLVGQSGTVFAAQAAASYAIGLPLAVWATTAGRLRVRLRKVVVHLPSWPGAFDGYRILHLSDLHVGSFDPVERARRWIERAQAIRAELVVVTGDLVASGTRDYPAVAALLGGLRVPDGVLVVTGNHDLWDRAELERQLEDRGARILDGRAVEIVRDEARVVVAGIGSSRRPTLSAETSLARLPRVPTLVLAHDPAVFEATAAAGVPLTLSGHTHAGQVALPLLGRWVNMARLAARYTRGLYRLGESQLYVNAGLGTTGLPVRLGARPEIVVLELRHHDPRARRTSSQAPWHA
ncbi:MAG: metallophosphoesterase [Polyangiaceae bacterium]|nr:metallophosphoesterase [Polyangiaceae bacterium]